MGQFYRSLAENLKYRLVVNPSQATRSNSETKPSSDENENERKTEILLKDSDLVTTRHWPRETDITYGDRSVSNLYGSFSSPKQKEIQGVPGGMCHTSGGCSLC
jgi:hypothetical protein